MQSPMLQLSPELLQKIASFMEPGYAAFYFKLTCKEVAAALREQYRTIQLRGEPRELKSAFDIRSVIATAAQPWPGAAFVAHWGRPEPWRALPRWRRQRLVCLAASSHHPPSLDAALAHCGTIIQAGALASAITAGDLETCRRLYATGQGCDWDHPLCGTAVGLSGRLPVCEWLAEAIANCPGSGLQIFVLLAAIAAGHERVVDWALERMEGDSNSAGTVLCAAAEAGWVELLQRLAVRDPFGEPQLLEKVAFGCPLAALKQYYEPWGRGRLEGIEPKLRLLLAAAGSPTPDWAAKCDWLWARWGAAAEALGTLLENEAIAAIMRCTDFPQRLQLLASRGLGSCLECHAPTASGAIGSTAAVEFCLDQLPALLQQQALAPVAAAADGGPAAAATGRPLPAEDPAVQQLQRQRINDFMELIALAAAKQGHVPVLRLLRVWGFVFQARHLRAVLEGRQQTSPDSLRYLLLEDPADLAPGADDAAADWSSLFRDAAIKGADLPLLRHLHEKLGAAIDLVAVAKAGGEEALSWAVAALEAAGRAPAPLSCSELKEVLLRGNWAAADWLVRHGLAPPKQELLEHMLLVDPWTTLVPGLQWVLGMGGGQDRVKAQVQWTAELHAALVRMRPNRRLGYETPASRQWLAELVEAVTAELAATAGGC